MNDLNSEITILEKEKKNKWTIPELVWIISSISILLIINISFFIIPLIKGESPSNEEITIFALSLFATTFGVLGTISATKKLNSNYIFGIVHVITYGIVAYMSTVYGDFILNIIIYLPMNIYGFYYWINRTKKYNDSESTTPVRSLSLGMVIKLLIFSFIAIIIFGAILTKVFGENWIQSIFDSTSTVVSIVGMTLMMLYFKEQWIAWFLVNFASIMIWVVNYIVYGDPIAIVYIVMWTVYLVNSLIGITNWYKSDKKQLID